MTLTRGFKALIAIRDSGIVNMWGAPPVLADLHDISRGEAHRIWVLWMKSFKEPIMVEGKTFFEGKLDSDAPTNSSTERYSEH